MSKNNQNLIAGLDIGSTHTRMVVGSVSEDKEGYSTGLQILGASEVESEGLNKGNITSIEDLVSSVSACLERAERMVGVPIDRVWVGVSGQYVISQISKGVVAVSKADSEIADEDVMRALEAAKTISIPLNYEVLHVLPKTFNIDGQLGIKDPIGMTGMRLEVDTHVVLGASSQIKNLTRAVYRAGLEIDDLVLSGLATSEAVLTSRQKELGVVMVDIGGDTTNVVVYEEGDLIHSAIIPIGSNHITNDIAIGLRTSVDIAERLKKEQGECLSDKISKRDILDLFDFGNDDHETVKRSYVAEIIEARLEEIFEKIDKELKIAGRSGLLPAGAVFTGGGSKLVGILEVAKKNLRLPAQAGYVENLTSVTDKINDPSFSTALGLVKWAIDMGEKGYGSQTNLLSSGFKKINSASGIFRKWFKSLIP